MKKALIISASILVLALLFAATQIPASQVAADGTDVSRDSDFQMSGTTLMKYTGTAKTVSVPASVTDIAAEAFADNTFMETLTFKGNNTEGIGYHAFSGCTGLKEVTLSDSVTTLGNGVFGDCIALEKVTFGDNLTTLGIGDFTGCSSLKQITIPKENTNFVMDDDCLYDGEKTKLYLVLPSRDKESYSMPNTVTDIAEYAFANCTELEGVSLGSNLKEIPDYAFTDCKSLKSISIPYSVNSIGVRAFADCVNLENVSIPSTVTSIHETAFDGCGKLVINAEAGSTAAQYYEDWKNRDQAEYEDTTGASGVLGGVTVGTGAWMNKEENENSTGGSTSGGQSTSSGEELGSTYVVGNRAVVFIDNSDGTVYGSSSAGGNGTTLSPLGNGELAGDLPKYTIALGSVIADQAFYQSTGMGAYAFPEGITEIGEFAYARSNLTSAQIPEGVTEIGYGAFYHCDYLRDVSIPDTVTYIAPKAFEHSRWLENWMAGAGDDYLVVGDGILLAYRGSDSDITLPDTVKRIAPEVFAGNTGLLSVTLPESLTDVGEAAFSGCSNLKTVSGGENVRVIRDRAFAGSPLESAHVGENVEYLGLAGFDFASTNLGLSDKVVIFEGDTLPQASYELTAQRLSNESARKMPLGDTAIAIVNRSVIEEDKLSGTMLDPDGDSFEGIIAYISSRDQGIVTCVATTYSEEEYAQAYIPQFINIDGRAYQVTGAESVTTFGSGSETLSTGSVGISNQSSVLTGSVSASLEGNEGSFYLRITDSAEAYEEISAGYEALFGRALPSGVVVDISLIDRSVGVPITKTGNQTLSVTLTLPEILQSDSLQIFTVDRNGQLEKVNFSRNQSQVTLNIDHLSAFAFCIN